jgi:hypothetical protein
VLLYDGLLAILPRTGLGALANTASVGVGHLHVILFARFG